ncbi:MAG: nucleotide sugar dehydrogenase [Eubacterium sp.]
MTVSVIGMSLLGIAGAAVMAKAGNDVLCTDMDEELVNAVKEGDFPGFEAGLCPLVEKEMESGRLKFSGNLRKVIKESRVIFITCEVPEDEDHLPNLRFVKAIAQSIGHHMEDYKAIVIKATTPPGTVEKVENIILELLNKREIDIPFDVITSPSIARIGTMLRDLERPKMVCVGADTERGKEELTKIYKSMAIITNKIVYGSPRDVEMANYGLNGILAVKVAYMNEMALLCEKTGANIDIVAKIMGLDSRISTQIMMPNPGFGGSRLPKNSRALIKIAESCGEHMQVLEGALEANKKQKIKVVEKITNLLDGVEGKIIGILGLAMKSGTDDIREAPALDIIKELAEKGAEIRIYSPEGYQQAKWRLFQVKDSITFCDSIYHAAEEADALVVMTKWKGTRLTDEEKLHMIMKGDLFIDLQNLFMNRAEVKQLFNYHGLGMNEEASK